MKECQGRILKGIGGFYYVETAGGLLECRARGVFRNRCETPMVGDEVIVSLASEAGKGVLERILPRKNYLLRPSVSNLDRLYIVVSTTLPQPNLLNIDKLTAAAVYGGIEPCIILSKTDLKQEKRLREIYEKAHLPVFESGLEQDCTDALRRSLAGKTSVFTGNSGVGKSTLINRLLPELSLKTGEISQKLSRGRHTTRHVELFPLPGGGYIADTPGFSSIELEGYEAVEKTQLLHCFPELAPFAQNCRFEDCSHVGERDCAVKAAAAEGLVAPSRYESYCVLYREAEKHKSWEINLKKRSRP